jgi:HEAT repeat protein
MKTVAGVLGFVLCILPARGADVEALIKQLKDSDPDLRRSAAKALGEAGSEAKTAVAALSAALKDKDLFVRRFSAQSLGELGPDARDAVPALRKAVDDPKKEVQEAAVGALGKIGLEGVSTLAALVKDANRPPIIRRAAADALQSIGVDAKAAVPALVSALKGQTPKGKKAMQLDKDADVRVEMANALGAIATAADKDALAVLEPLTDRKERNRSLQQAASTAIRKIKERE